MDYKAEIIDHYKHPRNFGDLPGADVAVRETNASCGDMVEVQAKFRNDISPADSFAVGRASDQTVDRIAWRGVGCVISTAAASMLSEKIVGMNRNDLEKFGVKGVVELLGGEINPGRMKCASLAYNAMLKLWESKA